MAKTDAKDLLLHSAPFIKSGATTPRLMFDVVIALLPPIAAAVWYFGPAALFVLLVSTGTAVLVEAAFRGRKATRDGSAALTGLLLGLTLPPDIPLWIASIGSLAAIGLGKLVWGGLGNNLFNPALVGRAFLQAAFPTKMTTWSEAGSWLSPERLANFWSGSTFAPPFFGPKVDVVTTASPLAQMKFEHKVTALLPLILGNTAGSLGETSAGLIILGGIYLLIRRAFDWRIPASILLTVILFSGVFYLVAPEKYPSPWFMVLSGGLLLGAVFMATDPVTSPMAPKGAWLFGVGVGLLVVLIRIFGGLPEGVMYSILLMNAATPLIERYNIPRPFGRRRALGDQR
jgi:electron transport complex protein RnfD